MRRLIVASAFIALASCKDDISTQRAQRTSTSSTSPEPVVPALCAYGKDTYAAPTECKPTPDDGRFERLRRRLLEIADGKGPLLPGADLHTSCALLLNEIDGELVPFSCAMPMPRELRVRMFELVTAWYSQRGDAGLDEWVKYPPRSPN